MAYTHLNPGVALEISKQLHFQKETADISALVKLSQEELKQLEQESIVQEEAIFGRALDVVQEWVKQASKTLDLKKAQEYLKVRNPTHTAN